MKLCACNGCKSIYMDRGAHASPTQYPDILTVKSLTWQTPDPTDKFWGCPVCLTDGWLADFNPNIPYQRTAIESAIPNGNNLIQMDNIDPITIREWIMDNVFDKSIVMVPNVEVRAVISLGINESTQVGLFTIKRIA